MTIDTSKKLIVPGAAGLVGQNLIITLKEKGYRNIVAIDKHPDNTKILRQLHPDIEIIEADISYPGDWQKHCAGGDVVIMLQAQIGAKSSAPFIRNNNESTRLMLETARQENIPYIVHISSSVVESVADDNYTNTKKSQEEMVKNSGIDHCILRPTLMFGWFDRKHLGWLSRFMQKIPVFPIPGSGKFMRQPLFVQDFCNIIVACLEIRPHNEVFNITGLEKVDYVDIIRAIKKAVRSNTLIVHIPYSLFWILLKIYALFDRDPPFTAEQLKALVARDEFEVIPWSEIFHVTPTPFASAIETTFGDNPYSNIILKF